MKTLLFYFLLSGLLIPGLSLQAQKKNNKPAPNTQTLFQAGVASAFIGGLYNACYTYDSLKQHGDFGLGAPDKLDGEMVMLNGKIYQTQYTGKTFEVKDTGSTSLAFVNFFHADRVIRLSHTITRTELYKYLDSLLENKNGIYAIHIKGTFETLKTRAFPSPAKPYQPLAEMLDKQHFFTFEHIDGDLIGYRLPLYLEALSIHGYHFHFLADKKDAGGHIIDFVIKDATIEINTLNHYAMVLPDSNEFKQFDFQKDRKEELRSVENGAKK
ncbi:acetolactate decarboxylase [Chitinophaga niastensis]|uniref:Alpha-acetolactate decarboxylase n=1 Tax=Chitinophaga niastensis TaxID=536980 RepID=A0A2P8HIZ7_CHINA|nr:acetolactate decarboxylase [Chitinophaga niastensis]PSL46193.1 acetolactate decarboxylase [Chitinophaga niastensis]